MKPLPRDTIGNLIDNPLNPTVVGASLVRPRCRRFLSLSGLASGLLLVAASYGEDKLLARFESGFDLGRVKTTDATVSQVGSGAASALRVTTGHNQPWPGIALSAPVEGWDLGAFGALTVKVRNAGTNRVVLSCRVDNPGADGRSNCVTGSVTLNPGQADTIRVMLKRCADSQLGGTLFGMRGYPVAPGGPGTIDPARVNQLLVFVSQPAADHAFEVFEVRATGDYTPPTAWTTDATPFLPFIDTFGQYAHKRWAGKIESLADLQARRAQEAVELAEQPGPKDWDQFGGWAAGPQLEATGFFRTQKYQQKWWLVDPEGRLFFSHGLDCVGARDFTPVDEREAWFKDYPGQLPEFQPFRSTGYALKGHYAGRSPKTFSFGGANLLRKYGADWRAEYHNLIHRRLRSWGLNTIANWSDQALNRARRTPYTDTIGSRGVRQIEGSEGYWGKFPDVFDASFPASVKRAMSAKRGNSAGDPWCLGYFSDNEMSWGDDVSLALSALRSPPDQPAKMAFVEDLKTHYGEITKLNEAWDTHHTSWDALLENRQAPDRRRAEKDLTAFYTKLAERYFRTVRDAVKESAPKQLYLGCRFAWVNARAAAAAAKYCDVVSYNLYRRSVADFEFNGGADVPLIIGEFHFGALDRGMFHTGLVPVANQDARAQAYEQYVRGALRHPNFVGCHWFQYQDEPTLGRVYDEENYQIGFVDVADTPYRETVAASRRVGSDLYRYRLQP